MPRGKLLKRWNDWSAGIGHPVDDGRTPGMAYASGLLGLRGELRPAPFFNSVTVGVPGGHHFQYYLEEPSTTTETPTFDARHPDSTGESADATTMSWSHTVGTGSQRILIVLLSFDSTTVATSVTFGGAALSLKRSSLSTVSVQIWFLIDPTEGADTVLVTLPSANEMVGGSLSYFDVDQSSPLGDASGVTGTGTSPSVTIGTSSGETIIAVLASEGSTSSTAGTNETERWDGQAGAPDVSGAAYTQAGSDGGVINPTIADSVAFNMEAFALLGPPTSGVSYLYPMRGRKSSGDTVKLHKVNLGNASFAAVETSSGDDFHDLTPLEKAGQPARYQGKWYLPGGNDNVALELTTVGIGSDSLDNDTVSATATGHEEGADHLANLNFQLVGVVEHNATNEGGVRILKLNGTATTEADWGAEFQVGDKKERAAGLRSLQGASFVMNPSGLFSFNNTGRSRLIFEDLGIWRSAFENIALEAYKGGLLIPHPGSGLLLYVPGEEPISISVDRDSSLSLLPPSGATELHGGRYHGIHVAGEFIYGLYQADPSSTTVLVLVAYPGRGGAFIHQALGTTTLQDADHMLGVFVALQGRPVSSTRVTPSVWFGNDDDLNYIVLDPRASPFRSRADTHKVNVAAEAFMSELRFTEPVDLTGVVIHTSADMVSGDEFQISLLTNGNSADRDVGPPAKGSGTRHLRTLDRKRVRSAVLHVNWTGTSTSNRVPPVIQAIELYGKPSIGEAE